MTSERNINCHRIIHLYSASAAAVGGSLAQVPGSDYIPISALQCKMIVDIGSVFGKSMTHAAAAGLLASQLATVCGRGVSQLFVGWIPGLGNAINAVTAASITEAVGWAAAKYFDY